MPIILMIKVGVIFRFPSSHVSLVGGCVTWTAHIPHHFCSVFEIRTLPWLKFLFDEITAGQHITNDLLLTPAAINPQIVVPAHGQCGYQRVPLIFDVSDVSDDNTARDGGNSCYVKLLRSILSKSDVEFCFGLSDL